MYYKVHIKSNWGHLTYEANKKELSLSNGELLVKVKYPDKTVEKVKLEYRTNTVQVYDHGIDNFYYQKQIGFYKTFLGIEFWVPVEKVKVEIPKN